MNSALKAVLDAVLGIVKVGEDFIKKESSAVKMADVMAALPKVMAAIPDLGQVKAELLALRSDQAAQTDFFTYAEGLFTTKDARTQAIIHAVPALLEGVVGVVEAFQQK